jgi:hypothetical protein
MKIQSYPEAFQQTLIAEHPRYANLPKDKKSQYREKNMSPYRRK